jgi:hypothetical protein
MNRNNNRHPLSNSAPQNLYAWRRFPETRRENLNRRQKKNSPGGKRVKSPAPRTRAPGRRRALLSGWPFPVTRPWAAGNRRATDEAAGALIKRIAGIICYVKTLNYGKQYMRDALTIILKHYTGLKDVKSIARINRAIESELAKYGGYQLSKAELKTIWMV